MALCPITVWWCDSGKFLWIHRNSEMLPALASSARANQGIMRSCGFPPYQQHDPRTTCHAARIPPTAHAASDMSRQLQPDTWRSGVQIGRAWRPSAPALTSWYGPIARSNVPARPNRGSRNQAGPHQKFTCFAPMSERLVALPLL